LITLHSFYQTEKESVEAGKPLRLEKRIAVGKEWIDATNDFDDAILLSGMVCGTEMIKAANEFSALARGIGMKLTKGEYDAFQKSLKDFLARLNDITGAVRKELKPIQVTSQSSVFSEAPTPAPPDPATK